MRPYLKALHPDTVTNEKFQDVVHGFIPRGDISQPVTKDAVSRALDRTLAFFLQQFSK
jgi:hypothetical protein